MARGGDFCTLNCTSFCSSLSGFLPTLSCHSCTQQLARGGGVNYVQREIYRAEGNFMGLTINQSKLTLVMTTADHRGGNEGDISWEASKRQAK